MGGNDEAGSQILPEVVPVMEDSKVTELPRGRDIGPDDVGLDHRRPHGVVDPGAISQNPVRTVGALGTITSAFALLAFGAPWWVCLLVGVFLVALDEYKHSKVSPTA